MRTYFSNFTFFFFSCRCQQTQRRGDMQSLLSYRRRMNHVDADRKGVKRERERERVHTWDVEMGSVCEWVREGLSDWESAGLKVNAEIGGAAVGGGQTNFEHSSHWSYYPFSPEVTGKAARKAPQTSESSHVPNSQGSVWVLSYSQDLREIVLRLHSYSRGSQTSFCGPSSVQKQNTVYYHIIFKCALWFMNPQQPLF